VLSQKTVAPAEKQHTATAAEGMNACTLVKSMTNKHPAKCRRRQYSCSYQAQLAILRHRYIYFRNPGVQQRTSNACCPRWVESCGTDVDSSCRSCRQKVYSSCFWQFRRSFAACRAQRLRPHALYQSAVSTAYRFAEEKKELNERKNVHRWPGGHTRDAFVQQADQLIS